MRLIDVDEIKLPQGFFEKVDNVPKFYEWLGTLPTVDAEPIRHGHWIEEYKTDDGKMVRCSACRMVYWIGTGREGNYCPHCGSKMDQEENT